MKVHVNDLLAANVMEVHANVLLTLHRDVYNISTREYFVGCQRRDVMQVHERECPIDAVYSFDVMPVYTHPYCARLVAYCLLKDVATD